LSYIIKTLKYMSLVNSPDKHQYRQDQMNRQFQFTLSVRMPSQCL